MSKRIKGTIWQSKEKLEKMGIFDVPTGAKVELYDIDKYESLFGKASKMRYMIDKFDYIIPTHWVLV